MNKYLRRLVWRQEGEKVNLLMYPFIWMTFIQGFFFTFLTHTATVKASILFNLTLAGVGASVVSLWGIAALGAAILAILMIMFRKFPFGVSGALLGFGVWSFAVILYALSGLWMQGLVCLGFAWYWGWYFVRVMLWFRLAAVKRVDTEF